MKNYKALRAMLACHGSVSERIEAGIDACRSDKYHAEVRAWETTRALHRDTRPHPKAERVPGAGELRDWLGAELDRIRPIRAARAKARGYVGPRATLRQRCEARVRRAVHDAYNACNYRIAESRWAGGEHSTEIQIGACPSASGAADRAWSDNGKWSGTNSTHRLTVRLSWIQNVSRRGLAVVDGLLTLDAASLPALQPGEEAVTATWARQGRGVSLVVERGILYRTAGGEWQHAKTLAGARGRGLPRGRLVRYRDRRLDCQARVDGDGTPRCAAFAACDLIRRSC